VQFAISVLLLFSIQHSFSWLVWRYVSYARHVDYLYHTQTASAMERNTAGTWFRESRWVLSSKGNTTRTLPGPGRGSVLVRVTSTAGCSSYPLQRLRARLTDFKEMERARGKVFCLTDVPYIDVEALGSLMAKIFLDSIDQIVGHVVVIESEDMSWYNLCPSLGSRTTNIPTSQKFRCQLPLALFKLLLSRSMVVAAAVMLAVMALAVCVWAPDKIIRKCLALPFRQVATEALVAKCGKSAETCETPTISPTCSNKARAMYRAGEDDANFRKVCVRFVPTSRSESVVWWVGFTTFRTSPLSSQRSAAFMVRWQAGPEQAVAQWLSYPVMKKQLQLDRDAIQGPDELCQMAANHMLKESGEMKHVARGLMELQAVQSYSAGGYFPVNELLRAPFSEHLEEPLAGDTGQYYGRILAPLGLNRRNLKGDLGWHATTNSPVLYHALDVDWLDEGLNVEHGYLSTTDDPTKLKWPGEREVIVGPPPFMIQPESVFFDFLREALPGASHCHDQIEKLVIVTTMSCVPRTHKKMDFLEAPDAVLRDPRPPARRPGRQYRVLCEDPCFDRLAPWQTFDCITWYLWGHGTDYTGGTDILACGRILPTDVKVAGVPNGEDSFSFYGRATDKPEWQEGVQEFVAQLHHSTKNSCGIMFGGYLSCNHTKSKTASASHENHLAKFHPLILSPASDKQGA
ncbi:unnamed protein product, partial [Symbiodinium natans]